MDVRLPAESMMLFHGTMFPGIHFGDKVIWRSGVPEKPWAVNESLPNAVVVEAYGHGEWSYFYDELVAAMSTIDSYTTKPQ